MTRSKLVIVAAVLAAALAFVPSLLPASAGSGIDAAGLLASGQLFIALGAVFLGGLLTALTPCVYPLIPITVSVFGARRAESRGKAVLLTSAYVLGMGLVFSVLGVVAALSGKAFGNSLGNPWVVAGLAVFLAALSASMFGAYELALPSSLATRLNSVGGNGLVGALLMGSVSGFLAAPCTGPVLSGVLAFVAKTQNPVLGGSLLFVYALGIGVPFFLLGAFTVRLPKSGVWMEWVKSVFGIALLALAMAYLRDAFPALRERVAALAVELGRPAGVAIAAVLVFLGVLLGAIHRSFKSTRPDAFWKGLGVAVIVAAILLRTNASNGPIVGQLFVRNGWAAPPPSTKVEWQLFFPGKQVVVKTTSVFDSALAQARAQGRPVMIDFFAEWCEACKELDRDVYVKPEVASESSRFLNIKVDATNEDEVITQLFSRFGIQGLPTVAFVSSAGELLTNPRVTGYLEADEFLGQLKQVH